MTSMAKGKDVNMIVDSDQCGAREGKRYKRGGGEGGTRSMGGKRMEKKEGTPKEGKGKWGGH